MEDLKVHVALVHNAKLPASLYGGTERVITWLAKGLHELGVSVTLACAKGSISPFANVVAVDFSKPIEKQLPHVQVFHYWATPSVHPNKPYIVTIEGNGKCGETFLPNTVFVSRNHAERHHATAFIYNGLDPDEYVFSGSKQKQLLFLAKASWRVKNVTGAIRIARASSYPLRILGGSHALAFGYRLLGVRWLGMVGGARKANEISNASALIFPVLWHEPFGLAVIESLVSGTAVISSPFGSLKELVPQHVGFFCTTEEECIQSVGEIDKIKPQDCRDWVFERFHYKIMAREYLTAYEKAADGLTLNAKAPFTDIDAGQMQSWGGG